ncbi:bifunctional hydroxymethylpyrimidine kinase/phosphomethylpyrimidine kinase [Jutongia huaianensis]|uniref:Hydroxymethylpyrimidine/phosphomethylpyrimidine kinase n=1 Tax=Jutongia huaianensis TaxID=2763668 RepID=A0ABR7MXZ7_9FIRM|nr:bifunctional hydroxymethylpyrimidine kinase/phosphomethylpyrimidine kinase [Jutongia huaianensis]MBC8561252.1 bifunctional hydroxymethylpyrimidine kinase/phosphomethylpyrimidine kinase [Jutongia huaianensis]
MNRKNPPVVLTIAGSDCSGGAGIQADLKTMSAFDVYGMSVITAVTAQNTCGVTGVQNVTGEMIRLQLEAVMSDIMPDAVKIGMLATADAVEAVADILEKYHVEHVILDPVMVSTSGRSLLEAEGKEQMLRRLFPLAELVTPNIPEAEEILKAVDGSVENKQTVSSVQITDQTMMEKAAQVIRQKYGCNVLLKGGHMTQVADDLLYQIQAVWFPAQRIDCTNTHGTGCTLSSAIASALARGCSLKEAVGIAKVYVRSAMSTGLDLGHGNGPLDHNWSISSAVLSQSDQSSR